MVARDEGAVRDEGGWGMVIVQVGVAVVVTGGRGGKVVDVQQACEIVACG